MCTTKVLLGRGALWFSRSKDAKKLNVFHFPGKMELLKFVVNTRKNLKTLKCVSPNLSLNYYFFASDIKKLFSIFPLNFVG